jgi:hypothetical protein
LDDLTPLEDSLGRMADAVIQLYKTVGDYREGLYPNFGFDPQRKIYLIVITLEDWHTFGPVVLGRLHDQVVSKLELAGLPTNVLDDMPYSVCWIGDIEGGLQVIDKIGIRAFFGGKIDDPEMRRWEWRSYMVKCYHGQFSPRELFTDEYDAIFEKALKANSSLASS